MGIKYDNAVSLAEASINLVICQATLKAMKEVTSDPEKSSVLEKHQELFYEAGFNFESAAYSADAAEEAEHVQQWNDAQLEFNRSNTCVQALRKVSKGVQGIALAKQGIKRYLSDSHAAEYGYVDTINPEGIRQSILSEQERKSHHFMMAALSLLNDQEIEQVLTNNQALDHDRSTFKVSSLAQVREWRAQCGSKTIDEAMNGVLDRNSIDAMEREANNLPSLQG